MAIGQIIKMANTDKNINKIKVTINRNTAATTLLYKFPRGPKRKHSSNPIS
jgi:hypothetical protein